MIKLQSHFSFLINQLTMVRKSIYGVFLILMLISSGYAQEKEEVKKEEENGQTSKSDEKTISKRGIFHLGIHGHPIVPHVHPVVSKIPVITKIPTVVKPIIPAVLPAPVLPTTPYHITHGGATVTSLNVNYPRVPIFTKTIIPPALPVLPTFPHHHHHGLIHDHHHSHIGGFFPHYHHHHHSLFPHHDFHHHHLNPFFPHDHHHHHHLKPFFPHDHHHHHLSPFFPHVHAAKPIVPIAVPVPGIRHPKLPVYIPQKPLFVNPPKHDLNPAFIPIPVPTNPQPASPTVITVNPGISSTTSHNNNHNNQNHINLFPTTQQTPIQSFENHQNSQGNWNPIVMQTRPIQSSVTENCPPYNYHAALKSPASSLSNNSPQTNNFISGQGPSMAQQFALYQQQQQLLHDQQSEFSDFFHGYDFGH